MRPCTLRSRRGSRPSTAHGSLVDADEPGHRSHQRRLAGAVRAQQPGDARTERATELRQGHLRPEPHRHVGDLDGRVGGERRVAQESVLVAAAGDRMVASAFHPSVAIEQHHRARPTARRGRSTTASSPPLATPVSGDSGSTWPRNTMSRRYSGKHPDVDQRGDRALAALEVADDDARGDRRDQQQADRRPRRQRSDGRSAMR